jgi:hypothetical protein
MMGMDLTKLLPAEVPATASSSRLRRRLNQRRQVEYREAAAGVRVRLPEATRRPDAVQRSQPKRPSRHPGVKWRPDLKKWEAWYSQSLEVVVVGYFDEELEAARARDEATRR